MKRKKINKCFKYFDMIRACSLSSITRIEEEECCSFLRLVHSHDEVKNTLEKDAHTHTNRHRKKCERKTHVRKTNEFKRQKIHGENETEMMEWQFDGERGVSHKKIHQKLNTWNSKMKVRATVLYENAKITTMAIDKLCFQTHFFSDKRFQHLIFHLMLLCVCYSLGPTVLSKILSPQKWNKKKILKTFPNFLSHIETDAFLAE